MGLWHSIKTRPIFIMILVSLSVPVFAATPEDPNKQCKESVASVPNQVRIAQLAKRMGSFMSHLQKPEFAGKNSAETMIKFGNHLQTNSEGLAAFHRDFNQMMAAFEAMKGIKLSEQEAKQTFALVLDQATLSRTFVLSYFAAQSSAKLLKDPSVILDSKFYNTEDADILVFSLLSGTSRIISEDSDDDDEPVKGSKISLESGARKIVEALEGNSFHPDGLLEGVRMVKMLFSSDPALKTQAEEWLKSKGERAQRLRGPFRQHWLRSSEIK